MPRVVSTPRVPQAMEEIVAGPGKEIKTRTSGFVEPNKNTPADETIGEKGQSTRSRLLYAPKRD